MLSLSEPALPMMFSDMKFMVPVNMFCSALLAALYAFFGLETSLAIGVVGFVFMNKPLVALISYLTVLTIHVSLILFRRKQLNSIG